MRRRRLATLRPSVAITQLLTAPPAPKRADAQLLTPEHRRFRAIVLQRAGYRCEWIENGERCPKSEANGDRLFADHIKERADGGALYDPNNGRCLCGSHHTTKTALERARRLLGHSAAATAG